MANQAFSLSEDLMVGAGEVLFKRADDTNGWHTLGNCDEMNITVDVTKVEKNSSLNRKRTLMQTVVTAVKPTTTITLTEYNAYNLALGLFGTEAIDHIDARHVVDEVYTVESVPGILTLLDANGNRVYNAKNISVLPDSAIPPRGQFTKAIAPLSMATTNTGNDTLICDGGGKLVVNCSGYNDSSMSKINIAFLNSTTSVGDLDGLEIAFAWGHNPPETFKVSGSKTTDTFTLSNGVTVGCSVGVGDSINAVFKGVYQTSYTVYPGTSSYIKGKDYYVDEQTASAGIIKFNTGSPLKAGDTVKISYDVAEEDIVSVSLADAGAIDGQLLYIGDNDTGPNYVIEGWKVKVTPSGDLSGLIGTDFGSFQLTIDFLDDTANHPDYAFAKVTTTSRAVTSEVTKTGTYHPEW